MNEKGRVEGSIPLTLDLYFINVVQKTEFDNDDRLCRLFDFEYEANLGSTVRVYQLRTLALPPSSSNTPSSRF